MQYPMFTGIRRLGLVSFRITISKEKNPNNKVSQCYFMMCKKSGISERKYKSHISENCFGGRSDRKSIKEGVGGNLGKRDKTLKYVQKD